jgi:hypothetical protein
MIFEKYEFATLHTYMCHCKNNVQLNQKEQKEAPTLKQLDDSTLDIEFS